MLGKGLRVTGLVGTVLLSHGGWAGQSRKAIAPGARCSRAVIEGEVRAGGGFRASFGGGLDFVLEPTALGWVVRVLPTGEGRKSVDYAEVATPPYRSVSPLLVSTDFSFRAQDAVGWNPRRFRYAADRRAFASLEAVYERITGAKQAAAADETALGELTASQPQGLLHIVDAVLEPGTGDQTRAAALLSTHYETTAHRTEEPAGGRATALGRIGGVRFQAKLDLRRGTRPARGVQVESYACGKE